ncbi:MAG TPA: TonB-dependent receptor [Allosphingosinicella sp.]|nr:TonB-dependent receptor [Allosphingosinicella sp.]
MSKYLWLMSAGAMALATPGHAQQTNAGAATVGAADDSTTTGTQDQDSSEIIVTATRRNQALSDVPLAVSAISGETLENSGVVDIRQLQQLSPSLLVTSTQSEAGASTARIRGIGTVGDNPGLESSVATFIDGVYRARSGVALTELGAVDRVEVLRGPQGTLFGRNASAGLIHVITASPRFDTEGYAQLTFGNYDLRRLELGGTGGVGETVAVRFDTVYLERDGFLRDVVSGRTVNDRNRLLARGQMLFEPNPDLSVRLIADYSFRNEECCGAAYLPARTVTRDAGGNLVTSPSGVQALIRSLGGIVNDNTFDRETAITPGQSYRQDVRDGGVSAEVNYDIGRATLTSITAYRENKLVRGMDADFNNLNLVFRPDDGTGGTKFETFTQELRFQGEALGNRLDWLVGGYYADESLVLRDNLSTGADLDIFARGLVASNPSLATFPGFNLLNPFAAGFVQGQLATNPAFAGIPAAARPLVVNAIASQVVNTPISNTRTNDRFDQKSRNFALFTHNIYDLTDQLSLTLGARYTNERKRLEADLQSNSPCGAYTANIQRLLTLSAASAANPGGNGGLNPAIAALSSALANQVLTPLASLPCAINSINGSFDGGRKKESEWSGTGVISFKPVDQLLTYASYSKGYKAGGFNLDRAGLTAGAVDLNALQFDPETVDAYELGAKYNGRGFDVNVALFRQDFKNFQLNTFNGINFVVENIASCSNDLGGADTDASAAPVACTGERKPGVRSEGVEIEGFFRPLRNVSASAGFTYADTRYRDNLIGTNGNAITPALFQLPGSRVSNSSQYSGTASIGWTPPLGTGGLTGLLYADARYQSELNTGSDLDEEKIQDDVTVVNARVGVRGPEERWSVELWAQNLFDEDYMQIAFDAFAQGSGTIGATRAFGTPSTQLFGAFLAEPRTYGITLRGRF